MIEERDPDLNIGVLGGPRWFKCPMCGLVDVGTDPNAQCTHEGPTLLHSNNKKVLPGGGGDAGAKPPRHSISG